VPTGAVKRHLEGSDLPTAGGFDPIQGIRIFPIRYLIIDKFFFCSYLRRLARKGAQIAKDTASKEG
jgi:hypothetical protein